MRGENEMYDYAPVSQGPYIPPQQPVPGAINNTPYQGGNAPQPGYQTVPSSFYGIQYVYVADPMTELASSTGVLIKQKPQFMEQFTGCESPNRYFVFSQSPQGGMKLLFKCKEFSGCCMRNCCPAGQREFNMAIKHVASNSVLSSDDFSLPFVNVNKPFKCTCLCLDRPKMQVNFANNQPLGSIKEPFTCCDPQINTFDNTGIMKYVIRADCCQCGLLCRNNFCGKLSSAVFNIYNANNLNSPCGTIIKKGSTSFAELVTSADSYQVNFPQDASPQDKMILIVAGLMIDYQFFEEKASNDNNTD